LIDPAVGDLTLEIEPFEIGDSERGVVIASQNSRNFSTRFWGGLPAISAELSAPIEMPATQSGGSLASAKA
jgi:hypothetical protein